MNGYNYRINYPLFQLAGISQGEIPATVLSGTFWAVLAQKVLCRATPTRHRVSVYGRHTNCPTTARYDLALGHPVRASPACEKAGLVRIFIVTGFETSFNSR